MRNFKEEKMSLFWVFNILLIFCFLLLFFFFGVFHFFWGMGGTGILINIMQGGLYKSEWSTEFELRRVILAIFEFFFDASHDGSHGSLSKNPF
jgi:hypothetical protein